MPKSNLRYKHVNRNCGLDACQSSVPPSEPLLCTPPRKVSFEDNRNDSDVSISSDEIVPKNNTVIRKAKPEQERKSIRRKRSLLVRPTTSLSLVDLAKSVEQDGGSSIEQYEESNEDMEERSPKRIRSFDISPRSVATHASGISGNSRDRSSSIQPVSPLGESASIRISPWGHFVDTTPYDDDYFDLPTTPYQTHNYVVKCNNKSRSWRRHSPYGDYKTITKRTEQTQPTLSFVGIQQDHSVESKRRFRLSPRNRKSTQDRSADGNELVGVFSELQVRQDVM